MQQLTRDRYRVALLVDGVAGDTIEVEITPGDQFRAELEAGKQGLPSIRQAPLTHTAVWVWCALVRLGHYSAGYQQFAQTDLYAFEPVDDDQGPEQVDPTTADPSGSASPSATGSPESTGSTPTSTPA